MVCVSRGFAYDGANQKGCFFTEPMGGGVEDLEYGLALIDGCQPCLRTVAICACSRAARSRREDQHPSLRVLMLKVWRRSFSAHSASARDVLVCAFAVLEGTTIGSQPRATTVRFGELHPCSCEFYRSFKALTPVQARSILSAIQLWYSEIFQSFLFVVREVS